MSAKLRLALLPLACLAACSPRSPEQSAAPLSAAPEQAAAAQSPGQEPSSAPVGPAVVTLAERYVTEPDPAMNIDSVATHPAPDVGTWLFATAKEGDVLRIYDAADGRLLRDVGGTGTAPGELDRPNGVVAHDGMVIVVERDNHRVQVFALPGVDSIATFGAENLIKPYGAFLRPLGEGHYELYVTDAYELVEDQVPPDSELGRRVHVFDLTVERDAAGGVRGVTASHARAFGETSGPGVIRVPESVWGDPANGRLMLAEEDASRRVLKGYSFDGKWNGEIVGEGIFQVQPEGIALYECGDGGYWIATDQDYVRNVFHLFDRLTLEHVGAFEGEVTRNTDGIWLARAPFADFPAGALFAVHDDQAVGVFDWRDIAAALSLPQECAGG